MKSNHLQLKKFAASVIHLVALLSVIAGIGLLYMSSNFGRGLTWIRSSNYTESSLFYNQLQTDITSIFEYASLRDAFETDGELDMDNTILSVNYGPNNTIDYTLSDLIKMGESYGYFLQDDWSINVITPAGTPVSQEEAVLVEYKSYDPHPVITEPGLAYEKMQDLCYQALSNFSRYSKVYYSLIAGSSNLSFQLTCKNDGNMEYSDTITYTNVANPSWNKIKHMGLYAEYQSDGLQIETNLPRVPSYIQTLASETRFDEQIFDHFIISIDTNFPHQDSYTKSADSYNQMRDQTILGLLFLTAGAVLGLLSLLYLLLLSGHVNGDRSAIRLFQIDQMSAEVCVAVFACLGLLACYVGQLVGFRLLHLLVAEAQWFFAEKLLLYAILYLTVLLCFFSLLRRYKDGSLWNGSLAKKLVNVLREYFTREDSSHSGAYAYVIFLLINVGLSAASYYLLFHLDEGHGPLLFLAAIIVWVVADVAVFHILLKKSVENDKINEAITRISSGDIGYCVNLEQFTGKQRVTADHINHIGNNLDSALQEKVKSERFKADLITNVSHDLKTPLTSIINYVDLLKREKIQNEKIQNYLDVLEQKSQRLKTLTEDLVEASKASSGNVKLEIADIDFVELIQQTNGEFEEKFGKRQLELVSHLPDVPLIIEADGRHLWRVLENLYNNAFKYAMAQSRIYVDMVCEEELVVFTIKNISEHPLNISSSELTERFVRGDVSRTTEGSGLGLSIAESLTELQGGSFEIDIDGDLFKVFLKFPLKKKAGSGNSTENVLELEKSESVVPETTADTPKEQ